MVKIIGLFGLVVLMFVIGYIIGRVEQNQDDEYWR